MTNPRESSQSRLRAGILPNHGFKCLFPPAPAGSFKELNVRGLGIREAMKSCVVERPNGTGDFLIMLFHDEAWVGTSPKMRATEHQNSLMIWPPGEGQFYGNRERGFVHSWIHCDGRRVRNALRLSGLPVGELLRVETPALFQQTLFDIYTEIVSYMLPDEVIVGNLIENFLRQLSRRLGGSDAGNPVPEPLLAIHRLIVSEPMRSISLEEMAKIAGMSASHFSAGFRKTFGISPIECLIQHRMRRAAYLLSDHNLTVAEIARQVGYDDAFHFSKMFKKHFAVGPRNFRNRHADARGAGHDAR